MRIGIALVLLVTAYASCTGCTASAGASMMDTEGVNYLPQAASNNSASLAGSLFKEDQAVLSNEDIAKILGSKVELPNKGKLAMMRFGRWGFWTGWSEEFARLDQEIRDEFARQLETSPHVGRATMLPSLVSPTQMSVPYLRQAAARVQADMLLVYRTSSNVYARSKAFRKDRTRAYCTVEAIILDTRTGLIPFTSIASEDYSAVRTKDDLEFTETVARAEQQAIRKAMQRVASDLVKAMGDDARTDGR
jgi:hypothetical protein